MFKMLIDTCVWLDLAKDYQRQSLLGVLEELLRQKRVEIILPKTVLDEFNRNRARVTEESGRSLSSVLKRAKEAVNRLGDTKRKRIALELLNDVDYRIPSLGEAAQETFGRIDKLFGSSVIVEASADVKLRAAERAIERKAPFHRQRNGIDDAILIETYADFVKNAGPGNRFCFVTHNTKDFSQAGGNEKLPHPDIASYFPRSNLDTTSIWRKRYAASNRRLSPTSWWKRNGHRTPDVSVKFPTQSASFWTRFGTTAIRCASKKSSQVKSNYLRRKPIPSPTRRPPVSAMSGRARGNRRGAWRKTMVSKTSAPGTILNGAC